MRELMVLALVGVLSVPKELSKSGGGVASPERVGDWPALREWYLGIKGFLVKNRVLVFK